jgi:HK97 family phage major capsid protein
MSKRALALKQERFDLATRVQAIATAAEAEARELTDLEAAEFDTITARIPAIDSELARIKQAALLAPAEDVVITGGHDRATDRPWGTPGRSGFGEFLQAVHRAHTGGQADPRLFAAAQGANSVNGADGGFLVGTTMRDDLTRRVTGGEVLSRVQRIPLDAGTDSLALNVIDETSRANGSRAGGVLGYWRLTRHHHYELEPASLGRPAAPHPAVPAQTPSPPRNRIPGALPFP